MAKIIEINSLLEYVRYLEDECKKEDILFRGQPREDQTLIPRIARIHLREDILESERKMFEEFRRQARPHVEIMPANDWEWLALAQHHGMATRLLDWTKNPLCALWFAVRESEVEDVNGVVWGFEVKQDECMEDMDVSPFEQRVTRVYQPCNITRRIAAQQGWFTVHGYSREKKRFIPLERNKRYKKRLTKLRIIGQSFWEIRFQLDRCGVNDGSMFPDLDGLSRQAQWLHSFIEDERGEAVEGKRKI